jgi:biofilm PGA synthesis lipoprotein PgaB
LLVGPGCIAGQCLRPATRAFTPPAERPTPANEAPWPKNHFLGIAYHDVEDRDPDQAVVAVRTERLIEQLAWLRENGYQAVSVDQILAARRAARAAAQSHPAQLRRRLFQLLHPRDADPARLSLAGAAGAGRHLDRHAVNQPVDFAGSPRPRGEFLTWQQIREVSQSGLVEIAAHTDASHKGILANPQGNLEPAATSAL